MLILAIETSCDETSAAVLESSVRDFSLRSNIISSQVKLHAQWGGVVPNLAAREHLKNITPVVEKAMQKAKVRAADIGLIAVTAGPGLIPALLIGVEAAKALSYLWQVPLVGIHHIEGHIYANFIPSEERNEVGAISNFHFPISNKIQNTKIPKSQKLNAKSSDIEFPVLCLVVSGGHTQLVLMKKHLDYMIIGETLDDAAGEAFDKVSRILGLGYPGGPAIAACAAKAAEDRGLYAKVRGQKKESPLLSASSPRRSAWQSPRLPRPMINSADFNFSFSGLKTAVLYLVRKNEKLLENENFVSSVAHEFQQAVIDVLVAKTLKAAEKYDAKTIMLAGGVSANLELRRQLGEAIREKLPNTKYNSPATIYTGDNAAMIGGAAHFRFCEKPQKNIWKSNWKNLEAAANLKLM